MAHPLDGARQKVRRARKHLKSLDAAVAAFAKTNPYRIDVKLDPETGHYPFRIGFNRKRVTLPIRMGLIAGDAVHNLRSALDHLAWALAVIGAGPGHGTQFPIFDNAKQYREQEERLLWGIAKGHRARIESLQPYHVMAAAAQGRPIPDILAEFPHNIHLLLLSRLDNMDKHRVILPGASYAKFASPTFSNVRRAKGNFTAEWVRMEEGAEIYRVTEWEIIDPEIEVKVEREPTYTILIGEPTSDPTLLWGDPTKVAGSPLDFRNAANAVSAILDDFAGEFYSSHLEHPFG